MINEDKLFQYKQYQLCQVDKVAKNIQQKGVISSASEFYPDIQLKKNVGYTRGYVPLKVLMLLYEQVVVKLPACKTKKQLEKFLGISLDDFVYAVQKKSIIPLIGDPDECRFDFYEPILSLNAPALFTRGKALLDHVNLGDVLYNGRKIIHDRAISINIDVQKAYEKKAKGKNIIDVVERDLSILYADLFLFGHEETIDGILYNNHPMDIFKSFKLANEILTYPILFGLGGVANFNSVKVAQNHIALAVESDARPNDNFAVVSNNLNNLLSFFDLATSNLSVKEIIEFQQKGGCKKLQTAMKKLTEQVKNKMIERGDSIDSISLLTSLENEMLDLYNAIDKDLAKKIKKQEKFISIGGKAVRFISGIATVAGAFTLGLGALFASISGVAVPIASYLLDKAISCVSGDRMANIINKAIVSRRFGPTVASIWSANNLMREVKS